MSPAPLHCGFRGARHRGDEYVSEDSARRCMEWRPYRPISLGRSRSRRSDWSRSDYLGPGALSSAPRAMCSCTPVWRIGSRRDCWITSGSMGASASGAHGCRSLSLAGIRALIAAGGPAARRLFSNRESCPKAWCPRWIGCRSSAAANSLGMGSPVHRLN